MTFHDTPADPDANSYASVAEFADYCAVRFPVIDQVDPGDVPTTQAVLIMAARSLDANFDWTGCATTPDVQSLTWPRKGMLSRNKAAIAIDSIPRDLKEAQCELAYQIYGGADLISDNSAALQGVSNVKAGSVEVGFQSVNTSTPESVDMIIRRMGSQFNYVSTAIPGEVRRLLVPSWFRQPGILRPVIVDWIPDDHRHHRRTEDFES
jgi:hypothetical protein